VPTLCVRNIDVSEWGLFSMVLKKKENLVFIGIHNSEGMSKGHLSVR
jgi:hypothetical protein